MYPYLKNGDTINIEIFNNPKLIETSKQGDLVLVRVCGEWILHRVVKVGRDNKTKGDWSSCYDDIDCFWGTVILTKFNTNIEKKISIISKYITSNFKIIRLISRIVLFSYISFFQVIQ